MQADVRSFVCTDAEGELLYRSLGDKADGSIENLVSAIDDAYPFEHNTWYGGVKADDVKQKKSQARSSDSSEDNVSSAADKDNAPTGGIDSGAHSGERRGQSSRSHPPEAQPGDTLPLDVPTLLRRAADAFEEKVLPMFEGYILSLKGHFQSEIGGVRTDVNEELDHLRNWKGRLQLSLRT